MGSEDWRRHRADELFGPVRTPWTPETRAAPPAKPAAVKPPPAAPATSAPPAPSAQNVAPPSDAAVPIARAAPSRPGSPFDRPVAAPPFDRPMPAPSIDRRASSRSAAPAPPPTPATASSTTISRRGAGRWQLALGMIVALVAAAVIGWLLRGTQGAPVASVAVPLVAAPTPVPTPAPVVVSPPVTAAPRPTSPLPAPSAASRPARVAPVAKPARPAAKPVRPAAKIGPARPKTAPAVSKTEQVRLKNTAPVRSKSAAVKTERVFGAAGPSFDCRTAHGDVTRTICGDRTLSALDRRLATRFAALDRSADAGVVVRSNRGQTTFLNARQACGDPACIAAVYRSRLRELVDVGPVGALHPDK